MQEGEPTLNVKLIEENCQLSKQCSEKYGVKIGFRILTNGVFIDEEIYSVFSKFKFGVSISVDGEPEVHDSVRFTIPRSRSQSNSEGGTKQGTWDTINKNILRLLDIDIKPYILCTITPKNYLNIMGLVKYCVDNHIGFRLSPVRDLGSHKKEGLTEAILDELIRVYQWLGENILTSMPIERFARFAEWNLSVKKQVVCGSCKSMLSVDQDGGTSSCQMRMDASFGNLNTESLESVFKKIKTSEENQYIASPETKTGECAKCYWRYTCAGGCPEHTRSVCGTTNSSSPWCLLYAKLFPHYIRAIARQMKRAVDQ